MGAMAMVAPGRDEAYQTILRWADKYKRMMVSKNVCRMSETFDCDSFKDCIPTNLNEVWLLSRNNRADA